MVERKGIMKKIFTLLFVLGMLTSLWACGSYSPSMNIDSESPTVALPIENVTTPETPTVALPVEDATTPETNLTIGQMNALGAAKSYLNFMAFSREGLIEQLEYEKYSNEDAVYAVDNCGADWFEQAIKSANSYLDYSAFSYTGLIEQLEYEGFTTGQATHGVDNCGADWFEQAAKSAELYLSYSQFSRDGLISQLEFEGFTTEQAIFGVEANGY